MSPDYAEIDRLRRLMQSADQGVKDAEATRSNTQVDLAKERTQYFEKLAIGAGAAIAAIVSFLGVHPGKLQPAWMMQCFLISLVAAMVAALYRNFRYPYYVLAVMNVNWIRAIMYQQERKKELFQVEPDLISWQTGEAINLESWTAEVEKANAEIQPEIKKRERLHKRVLREVTIFETICLVSVSFAMISLVCLALRNF